MWSYMYCNVCLLFIGADVCRITKAGDTAVYLATFGVLNAANPDAKILQDLILAGEHDCLAVTGNTFKV